MLNSCTIEGRKVAVGDCVGFKADIEQGGRIVEIRRSRCRDGYDLTLEATGPSGFDGEYIKGQMRTVVHSSICWLD